MTHFYVNDKEIKPDATGNEFQRYAFILNKILNNFNNQAETRKNLLAEFIANIENDSLLSKWYKKSTMGYIHATSAQRFTDDMAKRFILGLEINSQLISIEDDPIPQQKSFKSP